MANCANANVTNVTLLLSTLGGSVVNGMNLYNVLRAMPFRLTTHNVGSVNSIGNIVFLAGERRYAVRQATFMFHGVGFDVPRDSRLEEKMLKDRLESLMSDQNRIGDLICERTNISREQVASFFLNQTTVDAAGAAGHGVIDEVKDVNLPDGTPIISLVFQR